MGTMVLQDKWLVDRMNTIDDKYDNSNFIRGMMEVEDERSAELKEATKFPKRAVAGEIMLLFDYLWTDTVACEIHRMYGNMELVDRLNKRMGGYLKRLDEFEKDGLVELALHDCGFWGTPRYVKYRFSNY